MRDAATLAELDAAWLSFLQHLNRSFNKACAELKQVRKFSGWTEYGAILDLRAKDPLLAYLKNARDAEEHGIEPLASKTEGGFRFMIKPGATWARADSVKIRPDGTSEVVGVKNAEVTVIPSKFELLPVKNRGRTYPVPTTHQGVMIGKANPVDIAEIGLKFYGCFFDRAEADIFNCK